MKYIGRFRMPSTQRLDGVALAPPVEAWIAVLAQTLAEPVPPRVLRVWLGLIWNKTRDGVLIYIRVCSKACWIIQWMEYAKEQKEFSQFTHKI